MRKHAPRLYKEFPLIKKAREDSRDGTEKREDWPGPPSFQEPTSDHRAGDLRVVCDAAAERTGNMIMLRNMSNIERLCDLSPLINMATIQLDDNGGVGVKLHAICLKRHTHTCGCMGAGGRNAISKRAFAAFLVLSSFGSFAFNYYDNDRTRSTRQLEPTPKLALSPTPLLSPS